jgi:hypothetical protein
MLNVFRCPKCRKRIQTNLAVGDEATCPYCENAFTLRASHEDRGHATREALARIAIPVGYVLFVAVPMGLVFWFFMREAQPPEPKPPEPPEQARIDPVPAPPEKPPVRLPKGRKKNDKGTDPNTDPDPDPMKFDPESEPKDVPKPVTPVAVAIAPLPRELPEVFVAPLPREAAWKAPFQQYETKWETRGAVDIRVAALAITKVPMIDPKGQPGETVPLLVVAVEVRLNKVTPKPRVFQSWTDRRKWYSEIFTATGKQLAHGDVPLGAKFNIGIPVDQPLPPDGTVVRDLLLYEIPPTGSGVLELRLGAERCGEEGDIWFKIPESALKK